jgi:hypothetical protein
LEKTIFSTILNPLIWELPLLYIRGISRVRNSACRTPPLSLNVLPLLAHARYNYRLTRPIIVSWSLRQTLAFNHSSTNYCLVGIIVAGKKATGRFVMATIYDPTYVTFASIVLSVIEIVFVVTVGARDRFLYRCCFGSKAGAFCSLRPTIMNPAWRSCDHTRVVLAGALGDDPLAPLKHHRNKKLRIQLANLETTLEVIHHTTTNSNSRPALFTAVSTLTTSRA